MHMKNRTSLRRSLASALLATSFVLVAAVPVLGTVGVANAQGRNADEVRRERGRMEQQRYRNYYNGPTIYYSAPPVYYPPPVYYAPQGPSLNFSFPLWR
jgi:hypothetical protein